MQQVIVPSVKSKSVIKITRRVLKKESDVISEVRQAIGKKPHNIRIKAGSDVDRWCVGKNAWDEVVKTLIPKILDISVL